MTNIDTVRLKNKLLDVFRVKSHNQLKKKILQFQSLEKFIVVSSPFIFTNLFIRYNLHDIPFVSKCIIFIKNILRKNIFFFKCLFNQFRFDNIKFENKIFLFSNRITDQYNIYPISNYLFKRKIHHTLLFNGQSSVLNKLKSKFKKKIYQIQDHLILTDIIKGYIKFLSKKRDIVKIFNIFKFNSYEKDKIFYFYKFFFIYEQLFKRLIKNQKVEIVFSHLFASPETCALIHYLKNIQNNKKCLSLSYALIGLGGESALYVHSNNDIVLTTSKDDAKIMNQLKKNKLIFLPTPKHKLIGSIRNEIIKKNFMKKKVKKNKKLNLLFIKSNSQHYDNIDDIALKIFIETIKEFKNKINFKIKDRYHRRSGIINMMLANNMINNENLINSNELFVEKSIIESDICVGTCSSALTKQALWYRKPIIQLFKKRLFDQVKNSMSANTSHELNLVLKKLLKKNFLEKKKSDAKKIYNNYYLINQNPIHNFYKFITNL